MASYAYLYQEFNKMQKKLYRIISNSLNQFDYNELCDTITKFDETSHIFNSQLEFNVNYMKLKQDYLNCQDPNILFNNRVEIVNLINTIHQNINDMIQH